MSHSTSKIPPGLKLVLKLLPNCKPNFNQYKASVLLLTFLAYALYHASRKPPSIVKNALTSHEDAPEFTNSTVAVSPLTWPLSVVYIRKVPPALGSLSESAPNYPSNRGWPPFDGELGPSLLGEVDLAFLASYAVGMFFSGHLGDRICLRSLLAAGMLGSGIFVCLFGFAFWWNVHSFAYFLMVQAIGGLFQATGWPSVVTVVGNWSSKTKRGLVMGIWNAHTSVGNICGTLVASAVLGYGWGWSFLVLGLAIIVGGAVIYLFLVVSPEVVGFPSPDEDETPDAISSEADEEKKAILVQNDIMEPLLNSHCQSEKPDQGDGGDNATVPLSFLQAWAIPRVASFAFCLFFSKLVAYTFLYWLPFYIRHTEIQGEYLSDATAGNLSTIFDVGGTLGGILAGYLSDKLNARAIVAASFIYASLPALLLYRVYGSQMFWLNIIFLFLAGILVNGPYALITTAVSADLGTSTSLKGNSRALATVTAIIDGTGSIGAALGPLLTGYLSKAGWNSVFCMLIFSATIAGLLLTGVVLEEWKEYSSRLKFPRIRLKQIDLV